MSFLHLTDRWWDWSVIARDVYDKSGMELDLVNLIRATYVIAAAGVLIVALTPALNRRFLSYGPRAASPTASGPSKEERRVDSIVSSTLDAVASVKVPHSWFTSFYAILVALTVFWSAQIIQSGPAFSIVDNLAPTRKASMSISQCIVTQGLLLVQGSRRLFECLVLTQPSEAQMWIGHWFLGACFYVGISVAAFIEGVPALREHRFTLQDLAFVGPSPRTFLAVILFLLASGCQHDCHAYLASLRSTSSRTNPSNDKYKLPTHPAFTSLVAPHYTAECVIYTSLAIVAAPKGHWLNGTLLCALLFVVVNLGVTAVGTKQWYRRKFGDEATRSKWAMIPWVL